MSNIVNPGRIFKSAEMECRSPDCVIWRVLDNKQALLNMSILGRKMLFVLIF